MSRTKYSFGSYSSGSVNSVRSVCNLRFADDTDLIADSNIQRASAYEMELDTKKSKVLLNSASDTIGSESLAEVLNFKFLGAILSKEVTCTRMVTAKAAMARL